MLFSFLLISRTIDAFAMLKIKYLNFRIIKELPVYYIFLILLLSSFRTDIVPDSKPPKYSAAEKAIRSKYDSYAVFTWAQYASLLDVLSQNKFVVLPLNEMRKTFDKSRVIVGLRHDVDVNPYKALEMSKIEKTYGIRSTYYFLPTADYYGKFEKSKMIHTPGLETIYKAIDKSGSEIGIHNDLMCVLIEHKIDPLIFNKQEIAYYRSLKIKVYGTAAHGSPISKKTIPNYEIFSDFAKKDTVKYKGETYHVGQYSLKDFGFKYEAYFIDHDIYFSDSDGRWNDVDGFAGILKKLQTIQPGERIEILTHPDWWGRHPFK
jgi:hypothetical protein